MATKITTLLLDCDNTLVQSEALAFEACADLTNDILSKCGIDLQFTGPQLQREFVGQSFPDMMRSIECQYGIACHLSDAELAAYAAMEDERVIARLETDLQPCEGANAQLEALAAQGRHRLAVVSSSALPRVQASLAKAGQAGFFAPEHVFSAADSLPVPASKPDPAVYQHALRTLAADPAACLAVEDSRSGATAAIRAGIPALGYTGACATAAERQDLARTLEAAGCRAVMHHWVDFPACLRLLEAGAA